MVVVWTVLACLFAAVTSAAAATTPATASLTPATAAVAVAQAVGPKIVAVPCDSNQYWVVTYSGGQQGCFAQNGSVSAYPGWWAVKEISSGNNSGVIYYYSDCNWSKNQAGGTVLQYNLGSESIWVHDICMTGFTITGR